MRIIILLILLTAMLFTAGCVENSMTSKESSEKSKVVAVTQLEQINASIQKGPVFLKIGARWCPHCRAMNPILENMAERYSGNATIAAIDVDKSSNLKDYFGVEIIPDSCVIVGIENGTYVYEKEDGNISMNRSEARFIGLNETAGPNEENFIKVLDLALLQKEKNKPK